MATPEASICNLALARIGERRFITSLDTTVDTSQSAALCAVLYPSVRDALLSRHRWAFAVLQAVLAPETDFVVGASKLPGWRHVYAAPSDLVEAQYIFSGVRPGLGVLPLLTNDALLSASAVPMVPAINGASPQIPFEVVGGHLFSDWADTPAAWDAGAVYLKNAVVSYGGLYYHSINSASNQNHLPTDATWWLAVTDPSSVVLVYTSNAAQPTAFPYLFKEAIAWRLALDLVLSLATKPGLAPAMRDEAEAAYMRALSAEGNARQPDPKPQSRYITVRG